MAEVISLLTDDEDDLLDLEEMVVHTNVPPHCTMRSCVRPPLSCSGVPHTPPHVPMCCQLLIFI
jgi:hypothetical protein